VTDKGRRVGFRIRVFESRDAEAVSQLFAAYTREAYGAGSPMSAVTILSAGQERHFNLVAATDTEDEPIGFAAWRDAYDLHNAVAGAEIPDLFVLRRCRGRGLSLSLRLVAGVAGAVGKEGGKFVKGGVLLDEPGRQRLLHRIAVGFPGESVYLAGRAMRTVAEFADVDDARRILRNLPEPGHNCEP
jgi:hypothetical protein